MNKRLNPVSIADLPQVIALFPVSGALLLPRGQIPLTVFEPRYRAMIDDALKANRMIGMIQPEEDENDFLRQKIPLYSIGCLGRITQFIDTEEDRYLVTLSGLTRFRILEEMSVTTPYRKARVDFSEFSSDFEDTFGEDTVDRSSVLETLRNFAKANDFEIEWRGVKEAPTEALINALSMMAPFGIREKQALLEATDLRARAEILIAMTEADIARSGKSAHSSLQ
jgi:uncharacterized protein